MKTEKSSKREMDSLKYLYNIFICKQNSIMLKCLKDKNSDYYCVRFKTNEILCI